MRKFGLIPLARLIALILAAAANTVAQSPQPRGPVADDLESQASFIVSQNGKQVGTASFRFTAKADGYDSSSLVNVQMQGLDYSLSKTEELSSANDLRHVLLSATVNGSAVSVTARPDIAQLLINISANGHSSTTLLDRHPGAVFLPDFDPGALETLLTLAARHNSQGLWAIVPKQAGSVEAVTLVTDADQQGTLDGKPVTVHHLVATIAGAKTDLFSGPESQLLQAELPQPGFALVRKGFVLTPPTKPGALPAGPGAESTDHSPSTRPMSEQKGIGCHQSECPPFTRQTALFKMRAAEDAWNWRDPERVALV